MTQSQFYEGKSDEFLVYGTWKILRLKGSFKSRLRIY